MNTFEKLIYQLKSNKEERKEILDILGYKDFSKGSNKLLTKLRNKTISLKELQLISNNLNLDSEEIIQDYKLLKQSISKEKKYIKEIKSLKEQIRLRDNFKPYIYIETEEIRPSSNFLIYDKIKYIKTLPDDILEFSREEQKRIIREIIKKHYEDTNGIIFSFGSIEGYKFYYTFDKFLSFNLLGISK